MNAAEHKKLLLSFGRRRGDALDAEALQQSVIDGETEQLRSGVDYDDQHVRLATVHTRQDLVLLVSHLTSINRRLRNIQWLLIASAAALFLRFGGW